MADRTDRQTVELFINGEQANKEFSKLIDKADTLKKKITEYREMGDMKGLQKTEKDLAKVEKEITSMTNKMDVFKKTVNNLSTAKPNELKNTLKMLNKELNSGAVTRGSQQWKEYQEMIKKVKAELQSIRKEQDLGKSPIDQFNGSLMKFGGIAATGIAAITGIKAAVSQLQQAYTAEEDSLANLKALTGLDDQSIGWLNEQARSLSTTMDSSGLRIRESADQIMEAYMLVGSARPELLGNKEALNDVTVEAMRLAQAAKIDLGDAVQGVTAGLAQFSLGSDQAQRVVNLLAAGSQKGAANVQDQSATLIKAGVAASQAGLQIEELIGVTQTLADRQIKGEVSGTALRNIFIKLQLGAKEFNPSVVGLTASLENLRKANLSAEDMKKMFGEEGYTAASILIQDTDKVKQFTDAVTGTNIAFEQAAINSQTTSAKMAQLSNKVKVASAALYEKLDPAMMSLLSVQGKMIKALPALIDFVKEYWSALLILAPMVLVYNAASLKKIGLTIKETILTRLNTIATRAGSIATHASTVKTLALSAAKKVLTGRLEDAKIAWNALKAAMTTNVWVAIATAIAAVVYGLYQLVTYKSEATKTMEAYNKAVYKERSEAADLLEIYKRSAEGSMERSKALTTLKEKYGPYIQDLIDEKGELKDIEGAHRRINELIGQQIALKLQDERIGKIIEKNIDNISDELNTLGKQLKAQKGEKDGEKLISEINSMFQTSTNYKKTAYDVIDKLQKEGVEVNSRKGGWQTVFTNVHDVGEAFKDQAESIKEVKEELKSYIGNYVELQAEIEKATAAKKKAEDEKKAEDAAAAKKKAEDEEKARIAQENAAKAKQAAEDRNKEALARIDMEERQKRIALLGSYTTQEIDQKQFSERTLQIEAETIQAKLDYLRKSGQDNTSQFFELTERHLTMQKSAMEDQLREEERKNSNLLSITDKFRSEYNKKSIAEMKQEELDNLKKVHDAGKIEEEEYLKYLGEINKKYAGTEKLGSLDDIDKIDIKPSDKGNIFQTLLSGEMDTRKAKMAELDNLRNQDLVSEQDYNQKKAEINAEFMDKIAKKAQSVYSSINTIVQASTEYMSAAQEYEIAKIEKKYESQIKAAGKNSKAVERIEAEKEKEIAKMKSEYADKAFGMQVAMAVASTALAAINAYASAANIPFIGGLTLGPIAAGMAVAAGAIQIATLEKQRQAAKIQGYKKGGFTPMIGDDTIAGVTHGGEFVSTAQAVRNPSVRPMLDIIDQAQRENRVANLTQVDMMRAISIYPISSAGAVVQPSAGPTQIVTVTDPAMVGVLEKLSYRLDNPVPSKVALTGDGSIQKAQELYNRIQSNKTLKG